MLVEDATDIKTRQNSLDNPQLTFELCKMLSKNRRMNLALNRFSQRLYGPAYEVFRKNQAELKLNPNQFNRPRSESLQPDQHPDQRILKNLWRKVDEMEEKKTMQEVGLSTLIVHTKVTRITLMTLYNKM